MELNDMSTAGPDRTVSDDQLLQCFHQAEKPFQTAKDISEKVGLSTTRVHERLQTMGDSRVNRTKVGRGVVYWLSD
jgi:hypothetical protein